MKPNLSVLVAALSLSALACNSFIPLPGTDLETGALQTFDLADALPAGASAAEAQLALAAGTASLTLGGGAGALLEGQVEYNVAEWQPVLSLDGDVVRVAQGLPEGQIASVPAEALNQWQVALGDSLTNAALEFPAGDYVVTLAASLPDGTQIAIKVGAATLRLVVPAAAAVSVEVHRGPSGLETEGDWTPAGRTYTTSGDGPAWTIQVEMGVGQLTLAAE